MLHIVVPEQELFDERTSSFIYHKPQELKLEHSLVSLAKWEAKWHKPFLSDKEKTYEQSVDYIRCMTLTQNVPPDVYTRLTKHNIEQVDAYIEEPMTATWFSENKKGHKGSQQVTAELIYYWMIANNIPFECQKWHLNRLLTLIRVCAIKSQKPKKMGRSQEASSRAALNAARRKKYNTRG